MRKGARAKTGMWSAGSNPGRGSRSAGFTLIELIVVLVIAAGILAVAPPLISRAMPGVELSSTARELASALRFARNRAVARRSEAVLTIDVEQKHYTLSGRSKARRIPDHIELSLTTAQAAGEADEAGSFRFFPSGGSTGGRILLASGGRNYQIDVDWLTGRVRILE